MRPLLPSWWQLLIAARHQDSSSYLRPGLALKVSGCWSELQASNSFRIGQEHRKDSAAQRTSQKAIRQAKELTQANAVQGCGVYGVWRKLARRLGARYPEWRTLQGSSPPVSVAPRPSQSCGRYVLSSQRRRDLGPVGPIDLGHGDRENPC